MPKLRMPNGDVISYEGMTPEQAVEGWKSKIYEEQGYDPNMKKRGPRDVTQDMSTGEKFLAGVGSGMTDIARNAVNLFLPESITPEFASDEAIKKQRQTDAPLKSTGAGATGHFVGEMAALAPTGFIGRGAKALGAAKGLPKALQGAQAAARSGAARWAVPAAEGAVAGALVGGPENRSGGAMIGATGGVAGHALGRSIGRVGVRGIAKRKTQALDKLADEIEEAVGERPWFPAQAAMSNEAGGLSTSAKFIYETLLPFFPLSRNALAKQADDVTRLGYRAVLKKSLPHQKAFGAADDVFRGGGRLDTALETGVAARTPKISQATQQVRDVATKAMRGAPEGQFTWGGLGRTSRNMLGDEMGSKAPLRAFAEAMEKALEKPTQMNNIQARSYFYRLTSALAGLPLETTMIPRLMASKGFQKFVMGNTRIQEGMARALASESGEAVADTLGNAVRMYMTSASVPEGGLQNGER